MIGRDYYGVYPLKASRSITYWVSQNLVTRGKFKNEVTEGKNEKKEKIASKRRKTPLFARKNNLKVGGEGWGGGGK